MTLVSVPPWLWNLVEEESGRHTLSVLLKSEPLEWVWLLSLTEEWHWGRLRVELMHSLIPSLSGVVINLPSDGSFSSSPVWDSETLEDSSWSSVEGNISNSFQKGRWVEVLSIQVMHVVWLLVELLDIEVLDSNSNSSSLFNMESVGNEGQVWVGESDDFRNLLLECVSWVEHKLDPSSSTSRSDVVFDSSSHLSLVEESTIDHFV